MGADTSIRTRSRVGLPPPSESDSTDHADLVAGFWPSLGGRDEGKWRTKLRTRRGYRGNIDCSRPDPDSRPRARWKTRLAPNDLPRQHVVGRSQSGPKSVLIEVAMNSKEP